MLWFLNKPCKQPGRLVVDFDFDTTRIPQLHRRLRKVKLGLILMVAAMIVVREPSAHALNDSAAVPVEFRGSAGDQSVRHNLAAGGGEIIVLSSTRKQVTMNGQTAQLGGRLGAGTVTGISDSQLIMRAGGQTKRLNLYARVEKRITNAGSGTTTAAPTGREATN